MMIKNKVELIENGGTEKNRQAREIAIDVCERVLEKANPHAAVKRYFSVEGNNLTTGGRIFNLEEFENIYVIGGGKAGGGMAETVEEILGDRITKGRVNIPKGTIKRYRTARIKLVETSHPLPNKKGVDSSREILKIAGEASEKDLVITLISGGASSLLPLPAGGILLDDIQQLTNSILRSGAVIDELNAVRKHLSGIKGGRLAEAAYPATMITFIISDVIGDPLDVIASGPTVPDPTTYADAVNVLRRFKLLDESPPAIKDHLEKGVHKEIGETLKEGDPVFDKVHNILISTNKKVLEEVVADLSKKYVCEIFSTSLRGEAAKVGENLVEFLWANKALHVQNPSIRIIVAGGETTVTVRGDGKGGRNQELALNVMSELKGGGIVIACMGTDGIDGSSDAAGAIVDGKSLKRAMKLNLTPQKYLDNNDSFNFFRQLNDLIITGPTGTNINDIVVMVIV